MNVGDAMTLMFEIHPNQGAGSLSFGDSPANTIRKVGQPRKEGKTPGGRFEQRFDDFALRFTGSPLQLTEMTFWPNADLRWRGRSLFGDPSTFRAVLADDGNPLEDVGFVMAMRLGIAFTGFHDNDQTQLAVTVFAPGTWDHLCLDAQPFIG
jgi:hypothetical protein